MIRSSLARPLLACWFVVVAVLGPPAAVAGDDVVTDDSHNVKRVEEYLSANVQEKWRTGPTQVKNKAFAAAYPGFRFYYVFSPQYPVARTDQVSLMFRLDQTGKVAPVKTPDDYNLGLMKVGTDSDAKTAAAAIMSLTFGPFGPVPAAPGDVLVKHEGMGWVCTAGRAKGHKFRVEFDNEGKCTQVEHGYDGPLPICIGGSFRQVSVSAAIAGLGHELGGALAVISVEPDSVAARAGLVPGDILVSFADRPLPTGDVIQAMRQIVFPLKQQGGVMRAIKVLRDQQLIEMSLVW